LKQSSEEENKNEPEREDFLERIQSTKLLIPNFGPLKEKSKASSCRGSDQVMPEEKKEIANSSTKSIEIAKDKFEMKSCAKFSVSKPTKRGQIKEYVTHNLLLFEDESYNPKRNEYKDSLSQVKKDLARRK